MTATPSNGTDPSGLDTIHGNAGDAYLYLSYSAGALQINLGFEHLHFGVTEAVPVWNVNNHSDPEYVGNYVPFVHPSGPMDFRHHWNYTTDNDWNFGGGDQITVTAEIFAYNSIMGHFAFSGILQEDFTIPIRSRDLRTNTDTGMRVSLSGQPGEGAAQTEIGVPLVVHLAGSDPNVVCVIDKVYTSITDFSFTVNVLLREGASHYLGDNRNTNPRDLLDVVVYLPGNVWGDVKLKNQDLQQSSGDVLLRREVSVTPLPGSGLCAVEVNLPFPSTIRGEFDAGAILRWSDLAQQLPLGKGNGCGNS